jgi:hypothetical protein
LKRVLRCSWSRNVKHHSLLIRILTPTCQPGGGQCLRAPTNQPTNQQPILKRYVLLLACLSRQFSLHVPTLVEEHKPRNRDPNLPIVIGVRVVASCTSTTTSSKRPSTRKLITSVQTLLAKIMSVKGLVSSPTGSLTTPARSALSTPPLQLAATSQVRVLDSTRPLARRVY